MITEINIEYYEWSCQIRDQLFDESEMQETHAEQRQAEARVQGEAAQEQQQQQQQHQQQPRRQDAQVRNNQGEMMVYQSKVTCKEEDKVLLAP